MVITKHYGDQTSNPISLHNWLKAQAIMRRKTTRCYVNHMRRKLHLGKKQNNLCYHLTRTLYGTKIRLMRHYFVEDEDIGERAKTSKFFWERFQSVETTTVVSLLAQLARLQLEDSQDIDNFTIRGQGFLTRLQETLEEYQRPSSTPRSSIVCQCGIKLFFIGYLQPGKENHRVEEKAAELPWEHSTETQETEWFSGTVSEAWLQEGTREMTLLACWIPWHFAEDCRM